MHWGANADARVDPRGVRVVLIGLVAACGLLPLLLLETTPAPAGATGLPPLPPSGPGFPPAGGARPPAAPMLSVAASSPDGPGPRAARSAPDGSSDVPPPAYELPVVATFLEAGRPVVRGGVDRSAVGRRAAVARFGGDARSEDAVERGLAWLAAHQAADGGWSRTRFVERCPRGDRCGGPAIAREQYALNSGLTGLVLLAFLGAGYTDEPGTRYADTVAAGISFLRRAQQTDGGFSGSPEMAGYNNSLASFALAEYYRASRRAVVAPEVAAAVDRLVRSQQELGGWDYRASPDSGRNDTSISGWALQALASAASAGVTVPAPTLIRAALHFDRATAADGQVWYADTGTGFKLDPDTFEPDHRFGPAMTAVGLLSEALLGWDAAASRPARQRALLLSQPPSEAVMRGDATSLHSYYYWYYGALAMFQHGGDDWQRWNAGLRDALLPLQDRDTLADGSPRRHTFGSWPPYGSGWGKWGRMGGRVYTTALAVLTLEVYYREAPGYLNQRKLLASADWSAFVADASRREALAAIRLLGQLRLEIGEPALVGLLDAPAESVRRAAAIALAGFDSPLPLPLLSAQPDDLPLWERRAVEEAIGRARQAAARPPVRGRVRYVDPASELVTLELPNAFIGMELAPAGTGRPALRVVQRFSGQNIVVARRIDPAADLRPAIEVVSR